MEQLDSRRLTGPNVVTPRAGAVLEARLEAAGAARAIAAWRTAARALLDAVGWTREELFVREFDSTGAPGAPGASGEDGACGASLALTAPLDALYAATEVNECAFERAVRSVAGEAETDAGLKADAARLRGVIEAERNPALDALRAAAGERGCAFLSDDDDVSVGLGAGSFTWPVGELPPPEDVPWSEVRDVPLALITGTNGKTTTARLLAAIASAAGRVPGATSTDWLRIGDEVVDRGDWSGPGGARRVLRDRRTELAVLETARGGILRRGLAVERADVAAVLNVAEDHLGEWGVGSLGGLCDAKMVVTRVAPACVLNADDALVLERGRALEADRDVTWFTLDPEHPHVRAHVERGGRAALFVAGDDADGELVLAHGAERRPLLRASGIPVTLGGAARYNVANALAAAALADALGLGTDAIRAGLSRFANTPAANPGRLNEFCVRGARVLVDFAHNAHGQLAVLDLARRLPHRRLILLLGQAGDRDDAAIRDLVRVTWDARPDLIVIKELTEHLRGRPVGEVPDLIEAELERLGCPASARVRARNEMDAVLIALEQVGPGDLVLLFAHDRRDAVLQLVAERATISS